MKKNTVLNNGNSIPQIGFGTWQAEGNIATKAIIDAIEAGYKHIDTAWIYKNEKYVGDAIKESEIERSNLFVTTKLWNDSHSYKQVYKSLERSLNLLQLDYIDLYLIHWPVPVKNYQAKNQETWKAMEELVEKGLIKNIGVSNFLKSHIESLLQTAKIKPAVNQIKVAPGVMQKQVVKDTLSFDIAIEAYSPLDKGGVQNNPILIEIGKKYNKSEAQIALRWSLQKGYIPLPKSVTKERIIANISIYDFELTDDEMIKIDNIKSPNSKIPDPKNFLG